MRAGDARFAHHETTIARPPEEVFAFWSDVENNPRWQGGMRACTWTSPPPVGDGSTYDQVAAFLGKRITSSFVVEGFEPGRTITFTTTESTFPITEVRTLQPDREGSRLVVDVYGDPQQAFRIAAPLLRRMVQRSVERDYRRLKELLEGER